jgi:predicted nucleic acid-binding protein
MNPRIAFDSHVVTYFLRANAGQEFPPPEGVLTDLDQQHLATIRLALAHHVYVSPTARRECRAIREDVKRDEHERFLSSFFNEIQEDDIDRAEVEALVERFKKHHSGVADCQLVAEAIAARMDALVTNDRRLQGNLTGEVGALRLLSPAEAWVAFKCEAKRVPAPVIRSPMRGGGSGGSAHGAPHPTSAFGASPTPMFLRPGISQAFNADHGRVTIPRPSAARSLPPRSGPNRPSGPRGAPDHAIFLEISRIWWWPRALARHPRYVFRGGPPWPGQFLACERTS